jgi:hypothetical protein|tara:strand:- start:30 stop:893 length:864 start_codon:yes stop_codon:yes gene_type:complete
MAFPTDIRLPTGSRYYTIIAAKKAFNSNYDVTWSFEYKLPSWCVSAPLDTYQVGFATFLTNLAYPLCCLPGQYLGDQDPEYILSAHALYTEEPEVLKTEADSSILLQGGILSGMLVKIGFDSTGLYALTGRDDRPGVNDKQTNRNAVIIRDFNHNLRGNAPLSTFSSVFTTLTTDTYRTLRFRYVNLGEKLHIDYREADTTTYTLLTTVELGYRSAQLTNLSSVYCGFAFSTPISAASDTLSAKSFYLRNFNIEGFEGREVTTETVTTPSLSVNPNTTHTTVTNITA